MHRRLVLLTAAALLTPLTLSMARASTTTVQAKSLTITVNVPSEDVVGSTRCTIDADLYTPSGVSHRHPAPAIMITNGYGRSKADLVGESRAFAARGYVVLAYSGLGFGSDPQSGRRGSDCRITFDDRQHDGVAASQLVDFLGGLRAADDGTRVDDVVLDRVAHDGRHHPGDPRIALYGTSYGGASQFALAAVDPRIDTIIPLVTWNDLAYSFSPNNTTQTGSSLLYRVPGTERVQWNAVFVGTGVEDGMYGARQASTHLGACPNFSDAICTALSRLAATGYADATAQAVLRNASVASYVRQVRVPVLLGQGETDPLFPLREVIATYTALRAQHVPVKMIWHRWGHDRGPSAGEFNLARPGIDYLDAVICRWLDYWLKGQGQRPAFDFSYYAPWRDGGNAARAFVSVPTFPLPGSTTLYASGMTLQARSNALSAGTIRMAAPGSAPLSSTETSPVEYTTDTYAPGASTTWVPDAPLASGGFSTGPLREAVDVIGAPTARLQLSSPTASASSPSTMLVAFVKLYDVAPDGSVDPMTHLVAPIRVADLTHPVSVTLPAIVHRFPAGDRLELVVSLTDACCVGNDQAQVAQLSTSAAAPTSLTLPGRLDPRAFPTG